MNSKHIVPDRTADDALLRSGALILSGFVCGTLNRTKSETDLIQSAKSIYVDGVGTTRIDVVIHGGVRLCVEVRTLTEEDLR